MRILVFCFVVATSWIEVDAGTIYWANADLGIFSAELDGSNQTTIISGGVSTFPVDIGIDFGGQKIYWTDGTTQRIQRANLDGSNIEDLVTGLGSPRGLALDLLSDKIYWSDPITHKIQRANLDGSNVEDLVSTGINEPFGMSLDLAGNRMYWVDEHEKRIQRANLDGSNLETLVQFNTAISPRFIAIDGSADKLYWTLGGALESIQRANLDGSGIETLISGLGTVNGIALDFVGGMYWTDEGTDLIQRANTDGTGIQDITTSIGNPLGIIVAVPEPSSVSALIIVFSVLMTRRKRVAANAKMV